MLITLFLKIQNNINKNLKWKLAILRIVKLKHGKEVLHHINRDQSHPTCNGLNRNMLKFSALLNKVVIFGTVEFFLFGFVALGHCCTAH